LTFPSRKVNRENLLYAFHTAHGRYAGESLDEIVDPGSDKLGMILLGGTCFDIFGQIYDAHACLSDSEVNIQPLSNLHVPCILDADYGGDWNKIYGDLKILRGSTHVLGAHHNLQHIPSRPAAVREGYQAEKQQ